MTDFDDHKIQLANDLRNANATIATLNEELKSQKKHYEKMFNQVYSHDECQAKYEALEEKLRVAVEALEHILEQAREGDGSGYALNIVEASKWTLSKIKGGE